MGYTESTAKRQFKAEYRDPAAVMIEVKADAVHRVAARLKSELELCGEEVADIVRRTGPTQQTATGQRFRPPWSASDGISWTSPPLDDTCGTSKSRIRRSRLWRGIDSRRRLVEHHGLRRVVIEGLTPKGKGAYAGVLAALAATDERLAGLLREHRDVRGRDPAVDRAIEELERGHRRQLLEYGAAGRLVMRGLVEVLPLDNDALERANPVTADGLIRLDPAAVEARHDAQVRAALSSGTVAVIMLGGAHDLSAAVARAGNATAEYKRVAGGP